MVGKTLGHYEILEPLGAGGMGDVYRGHDTNLKRDVAIKVLPEDFSADEQRLARLKREAHLLASVNHTNIAAIYNLEESSGSRWLVLELVEGETLEHRLGSGPVPVRQSLRIARQVAAALEAAHEKGIVHRDLKPANVMVDAKGTVKVLDFGIAKATLDSPTQADAPAAAHDSGAGPSGETVTAAMAAHLTATGTLIGTAPYMSPEQIRGEALDKRSDIWSFGCLMFELLTGRRPFDRETMADTLSAILEHEPNWDLLPPDTPESVEKLIRRCLQKDAGSRLHDIADARIEVQEILDGPSGAHPVSALRKRQRTKRWIATAASVAILSTAVGWWVMQGGLPTASGDPAVVIVAPLTNETGDTSLDSFGRLLAEALGQGIATTGGVEVVPTRAAFVDADPGSPIGTREILAAAADAGAGTAVSGSYYLQGDTLHVRTEVVDLASGEIVHPLDPVEGHRADQMSIVDAVSQRVMGLFAVYFGDALQDQLEPMVYEMLGSPELWSKIPDYDALQEFLAGMGLFAEDSRRALVHLLNAGDLDPYFFATWAWANQVQRNLGLWADAAEGADYLESIRDRLSALEQLELQRLHASVAGDAREQRRLARQVLPFRPDADNTRWLIEELSLNLNEPHSALANLSNWEPTAWFEARIIPGTWYFRTKTGANHLIGDYEAELREARRGQEIYPNVLDLRSYQVRALSALGEVDEIQTVIEECMAIAARGGGTPDAIMYEAARELRAHGHPDAAQAVADQAVAWLRGRPQREQPPFRQITALLIARKWQQAHDLAKPLATENPDDIVDVGRFGLLAARIGDTATARRIKDRLREMDQPFVFGRHVYWQAAIAAVLGDLEEAMELLRERIGITGGGYNYVRLHADPHFESLHGFPPFEELLRPKG